MSPITKIIGAITSVGLVGGGVGLGIHLTNYSTLKDRLTKEGFNLNISSEEWTEIAKFHNTAQKNFFQGKNKEDVEWLKSKCSESLNKKEKDETNYKLARQWCTKPESMNSILGRKLKILITSTEASDDNDWKEKISNSSDSDKKALNITTVADETTNIKDIKAKCKAITDKKTIDPEFNEKFDIAKRVCAKE